jgi:hypothetical protein
MSKITRDRKAKEEQAKKESSSTIAVEVEGCNLTCPFYTYNGGGYHCFISKVNLDEPDAFQKCPLRKKDAIVTLSEKCK